MITPPSPAETTLISRREELLASLTKEQDSIIKTKKEIKQRFDAVDTYLNDYSKVSYIRPCRGLVKLILDHECGLKKDQGCWRVHIRIELGSIDTTITTTVTSIITSMYVYV